MRHTVLAEVPEDLMQLSTIDTNFDVLGRGINDQLLPRQLQCRAELLAKAKSPGSKCVFVGFGCLSSRELKHVFDDAADACRVCLHDLGQATVLDLQGG